jgi:hypothetical protein
MITCPRCQRQVLVHDKRFFLTGDFSPKEGDNRSFDCPTTVVLGGKNISHYYYRSSCFPYLSEYTLHISPFHLSWLDQCSELRIYSEYNSSNSPIKFVKADFPELLRWIDRLNNMKVFV